MVLFPLLWDGPFVTSDLETSEGGRVRGRARTRLAVVGRGTGRTCLTFTDGLLRLTSEKSDATLVACVLTESSEEVEFMSVSPSYPLYELLSYVLWSEA